MRGSARGTADVVRILGAAGGRRRLRDRQRAYQPPVPATWPPPARAVQGSSSNRHSVLLGGRLDHNTSVRLLDTLACPVAVAISARCHPPYSSRYRSLS